MQRSGGLHEMGYPKWQLVLCLLLVYSMLYLSLFKGVKSSGTLLRIPAFNNFFDEIPVNALWSFDK
jgi:solute carrier family 6 noradrenalin transporter-like protein 2